MAYTGPGDIVAANANTIWYGLRAFNAAGANGTTKSVNVTIDGGTTNKDIVILSSGYLDVPTALSYASGATGSLHVITWYDQSGNSKNITQGTDANRPTLNLPANAMPYVSFAGSQWLSGGATTVNAGTQGSFSLLLNPGGSATSEIITLFLTGTVDCRMRANFTAGSGAALNGNNVAFGMTDNVWHELHWYAAAVTGSGTADVDGTQTGPSSWGTPNTGAAAIYVAEYATGVERYTGSLFEIGWWNAVTFTAGNVTSIRSQQTTAQSGSTWVSSTQLTIDTNSFGELFGSMASDF